MNLLFETLIWLLIIQVFVTVHYWTIERNNKTPDHMISWFVSFVLAALLSIYCYDETTLRIISMVYLGLTYWILFPLQLNIFRNKPLLYIGKDRLKWEDDNRYGKVIWVKEASWLDNLERSLGNPALTLELKIILWCLSLVCLILL